MVLQGLMQNERKNLLLINTGVAKEKKRTNGVPEGISSVYDFKLKT